MYYSKIPNSEPQWIDCKTRNYMNGKICVLNGNFYVKWKIRQNSKVCLKLSPVFRIYSGFGPIIICTWLFLYSYWKSTDIRPPNIFSFQSKLELGWRWGPFCVCVCVCHFPVQSPTQSRYLSIDYSSVITKIGTYMT